MPHTPHTPTRPPRPGLLSEWLDWPETWPMPPFGDVVRSLRPDAIRVEEYVEDHTLVIRAELPGVDPERDVSITVSDGALRIEAERVSDRSTPTAHGFRSEFRYGSLRRVVPLPEGAREDDVTASYENGILEVRVPVPETAPTGQPRVIPVRHT